jgi:hypothetical protein
MTLPRPRSPRRPIVRTVTTAVATVLTSLVLAGCLTGERPTLVADTPIDDAAAATVLERLDRNGAAAFTATYAITPTSTGEATTATVVQDGPRRRITIGDVEFTTDGTVSRTCVTVTAECVDFLDDARISDLAITHQFYAGSFAQRLERDASIRVASSVGGTATIAGQPAVCVDISVPSAIEVTGEAVGIVVYCAIEAGVLGRYVGADVVIELTEFTPAVDPASLP